MSDAINNQFSSKIIFRNSIVAIVQVIISTIIMFFLYSYLLREIGPDNLGLWSILMATANSLRVGEFGMSGSVVKFVAKYRANNDLESASKVIQTGFISLAVFLILILVILYPLLIWILKFIFPATSNDLIKSLLPLALIYLWLLTLGGVYQSGLDGCVRTDLHSALILFGNILVLLFSLLLVPRFGLLGLMYAQIFQSILLLVSSWLVLRKIFPIFPLLKLKWTKSFFSEMLNYGYKVQIIGIAVILTDPIIKMLIGKFGGLAFTGYFDMGLRLIQQVRSLILSANQTLVPIIAHLQETTNKKINSVYLLNFQLITYFSLPIYFAIALLAPIISEFWIGEYINSFVQLLIILSVSESIHIMAGPAYFINLGTGKLNWNVRSQIGGLIIGFAGSGVLGYFFGGIGVVIGFAISLVVKALLLIVPFHNESKIPFTEMFPQENKLLIIYCVIITIGYITFFNFSKHMEISWFRFVSAFFALGLLVLTMWRHPFREKIFQFLRQKLERTNAL